MAALPPGGSAAMGTTLSGYAGQGGQMNLIDDVRLFIVPMDGQLASQ
jgi:hypothetical protein